MYKQCKKCSKSKEIINFHKNNKAKDGLHSYCKECNKEAAKISMKVNKNKINEKRRIRRSSDITYKEHISLLKKKSYWNKRENQFLIQAKQALKRRGLECNITLEDIIIPDICPILNVKLDRGRYSPSLDRKDNTKGYIKGNIWVISKLANRMKNDASLEEILNFCNNLPKLLKV